MSSRFATRTLTGDNSHVLAEFDHPPADPVELFGEWFDFAVAYPCVEPGAFALALVDDRGRPSTRTLLMKDWDERGLLFVTTTGPVKRPGLAAGRPAAATFYWQEIVRQVQLKGEIQPASPDESDALFAKRPRTARAAAIVSHQSEPLDDEDAFNARVVELATGDDELVRPERWGGFRLLAHSIEFWQGGRDRMHRRLLYTRDGDAWRPSRLQP
jgi:pyridoxamine 5'-phosphate oxidase